MATASAVVRCTLASMLCLFILSINILPALSCPTAEDKQVKADANHATADELQGLNGIGPYKAAAIIKERDAHGQYIDARDLTRVKGIGEALAYRLGEQMTFRRP